MTEEEIKAKQEEGTEYLRKRLNALYEEIPDLNIEDYKDLNWKYADIELDKEKDIKRAIEDTVAFFYGALESKVDTTGVYKILFAVHRVGDWDKSEEAHEKRKKGLLAQIERNRKADLIREDFTRLYGDVFDAD